MTYTIGKMKCSPPYLVSSFFAGSMFYDLPGKGPMACLFKPEPGGELGSQAQGGFRGN
ncbi:hypothetical protein ACFEL9_13910 [Terrimonas sp. R1]